MKKYLTSLLVLFLLLMTTGRAAAAEINSVMLNRCISSYGDTSWSTQDGLYSGMGNEPLNLTNSNPEGVNVFVLNSFTANVTGKLTSLVMKSRIYESGTTAPDAWQTLTAAEYGSQWMCEANYNVLSGLTYHKTYLWEFYFEGTDDQAGTCYLKNGEGNFVYTFYTGGMSMMYINWVQVQVNMGSGAESQYIPSSGMSDVDLTDESETDFVVSGFTAGADGVSSLKMNYCIYPASGTASEWKSVAAAKDAENEGQWVCSTPIDVLEGLTVGETYVLEFNFQGSGTMIGQDCWYNNGDSNYKIRFTKAEKVVAFLNGETAGFQLSVNGKATDYTLTGQSTRTPATASLGSLSTLTCDAAWLKAQVLKSGLTFSRVRMAYVIYRWENERDGHWYYVDLTEQADQGSDVMKYSSNGNAVNLLEHMYMYDYQDYTLEVRYELQTADGNKYRLEGGDAFKFTFTYMDDYRTYIESASINVTTNDETETKPLLDGGSRDNLGTLSVFRMNSISAVVHEQEYQKLTEMYINYRVYKSGHESSATWQQHPMQKQSDGTWKTTSALDLLSGLTQGVTYSMEYEIIGIYDDGYGTGRVNYGKSELEFVMGDPSLSAVHSVTTNNDKSGTAYTITGIRAPMNYRGIIIKNGKKYVR